MLPSSKSPSTVPGRRAVPFLAASRSISAWGETTASGPSAPSPAPGTGDLGPKAQSGAHGWEPGWSRCSRPPATPGHPARPPFTWPSSACLPQRVPCRPGLCSSWLVPASHMRPEPATPASRCGGGEGPGPQESPRKPAASAGPSATNASPSPPGARASPLPPTRASCQPPTAQHKLQPR